ncbi:MAG: glycosyltransferase family 2 protein [Anaerolineales bacterium]|nr:glycosyltransferase family 2 protein [Anaerolineales bacterium]
MTDFPQVSIVIVSWNSGEHLTRCLSLLAKQTFQDFEIILIDNGSTDDALKQAREKFAKMPMTIKELESNVGFAVANNLGAQLAKGKWLALLNADAYPEAQWLEALLKAARDNPRYASFSSRQIQYDHPHLLDGAGDAYHVSGLAWRNGYNLSAEENGLEQREVFSPCAAAALYSREEFLQVGGFDEDYFSYFEDVDLGFRLRLNGGRCLYVPSAVVRHVGSASTGKVSDFVIYHGHRNLVWTYVKNMPALLFWLYLPLHLMMNVFFIFSFIFQGKGDAILRAKKDALRGLFAALKKRRLVQKMKKATLRDLLDVMQTGWLDPYLESRRRKGGR